MSLIPTLLARVEAATGADPMLDFDIWRALTPDTPLLERWADQLPGMDEDQLLHWASRFATVRHVTASFDAVQGLWQEVLPDWYLMVDGGLVDSFEVCLTDWRVPSDQVREDESRFFARATTLHMALLAAVLKVKSQTSP